MRRCICVGILARLCLFGFVRADDGPPKDSLPSLSPAMQSALVQLSSDQFAVREKAREQLKIAFQEQAMALASQKGPEMRASLLSTLQFDEGLVRWEEDMLALPPDQRDAELQLVADPKM